jgi:hypothetical protein
MTFAGERPARISSAIRSIVGPMWLKNFRYPTQR